MSQIKPAISIFGPSYRPENWMDLYGSIGENEVRFEIVFVGPNEPDFELPSNLKFIKSCVKPMQCFEIAARNTTGDLIMDIADDVEFRTKSPLDRLYNIYKSYNNYKLIISCRYMQDGVDLSEECHRFFAGDKSSPVLPLSGLMSRKLYREIGGIDRNFIAIIGGNDLAMRAHANGAEIILSDVYLDETKSKSRGSQLCVEYWNHDRGLLMDLWVVNGKVQSKRARPVEPFSDIKIMEESQGPRGRWRGNGFLLFEKIEDNLPRVIRGIRKPSMYLNYAKRIALHINRTVTKNND